MTIFGRKTILQGLVALLLCTLSAPVTNAEIYRWRDEQGRLHFSDSPQNVPEHLRPKVNTYQTDPDTLNLVSTPGTGQAAETSPADAATASAEGNSISIPFTAKEGLADRGYYRHYVQRHGDRSDHGGYRLSGTGPVRQPGIRSRADRR